MDHFMPYIGMGLAIFGSALGCGLSVIGGGIGIGKLAASAMEGMARQPETAGRLFTSMLISAAFIEGFTLFAVLVCFLGIYFATGEIDKAMEIFKTVTEATGH